MQKYLFIFAALPLLFSSCQKECSRAYTGADCKTEVRASLFGNYKGMYFTNNTPQSLTFQVGTLSTDATQIQIGSYKAEYISPTRWNIPTQQVNQYTAYGMAEFSGKELIFTVTLTTPGSSSNIYFTGVKID